MNKIWSGLGLAVLGIAILVGAATAQTDDTALSGTNPLVYSITAPNAVAFGTFDVDDEEPNLVAADGTTYAQLSLTTNGPVSLQAYESGATGGSEANDGCMHIDGTATKLASLLKVSADATTYTAIGTSSADPAAFASNQEGGSKTITFSQLVTDADTAGTYEITVTFAAVGA